MHDHAVTEDQENRAVAAVRERIEADECLDSMLGVPGEDLDGTSFVDLRDPIGPMGAVDPNPAPEDEMAASLFREDMALASWLRRWTESRLRQPSLLQNPDTGAWRGATDADWQESE